MNMKPVSSFATIILGAVLTVSPAVVGGNGVVSYGQAFAGPGNSGDHGNSGGDHGGNSNRSSASTATYGKGVSTSASSIGALASALGALNAYHAAPEAFNNASPDSEVGKIAAYWNALQSGLVDQVTLDAMLDDAANKPLDLATREAFNQLLQDKLGSTVTTTTTIY